MSGSDEGLVAGEGAALAPPPVRPRRSHRPHAYSSAADEPRARRPTDVLLLGFSVLALWLLSFRAPGPTPVDETLTAFLQSLPGLSGLMWDVCFALLTVWALVLIAAAAVPRARRRLLFDYSLALILAFVAAEVASAEAGTSLEESLRGLTTPGPPPTYVGLRIAVTTGIIVAASPHLSRMLRFVGRTVLALGSVAGIILGVTLPIGVVGAVLAGIAGAALTHLILGSPGGRPTSAAVTDGLIDLGLDVTSVDESSMTLAGSVLFRAHGAAEGPLMVKAYGRDAWDGQLLTSTWASLWRRGETPDLAAGRLPRAEHEALACVMAERAGVAVLPVLAVGRTDDGDVLIVSRAPSGALLHAPEVADQQLDEAWRALGALHAAGMSHGSFGNATLQLDQSGAVVLADFAGATLTSDPGARMVDDVRLLVATALSVGPERALEAAHRGRGDEGLAAMLPYIQAAALDPGQRRAVRDSAWSLKALLKQASALSSGQPPELQQLSRVSWGAVIKVALIVAFAYWLVGFVAEVDWAAVADALRTAQNEYLIAGLLLSPVVQFWFSFSTLGSTTVTLRFVPVLMLQYAIQFIQLVLPSTAARVALVARFFQNWGVGVAAATSMGAIDGFMGFVVQVILMVAILLGGLVVLTPGTGSESDTSTDTTTDTSSDDTGLLAVAAVMLVIGGLAVAIFPAVRRNVVGMVRRSRDSVRTQAREARSTLGVLRSPRALGLMLMGNFGGQVVQAIILGLCLQAFGESADLAELILVNTVVSLFAGLLPVPGGIGVSEAGYTYMLEAIGIPSPIALSTAMTFRMVTFYLPPAWGWFATKWLRGHGYL